MDIFKIGRSDGHISERNSLMTVLICQFNDIDCIDAIVTNAMVYGTDVYGTDISVQMISS